MIKISKPAATDAGPSATAGTHQSRPTKTSVARGIARRLLIALGAAPVFYGFAAQLVTLAQLLGACA